MIPVPTLLVLLLLTGNPNNGTNTKTGNVKTGLDVLITEARGLIEDKRVGVIANHSSVTFSGEWILNALSGLKDLKVEILFTPEHGLDLLDDETRQRWKDIPKVDLHGERRRPDVAILSGLDAIIFDVQDVGCRFYTYISTLLLAMDASAEAGIEFIVLDRPNPLGGIVVEGPVLELDYRSFVGMYPIPIRYGLTVGELALMANSEGYLPSGAEAKLTIVKMKNWKRSMYFDDTGVPWKPPSPNLPDLESAVLYPGMCLLEGTNLSEGRGTPIPFKLVGAPWLPNDQLLESLGQDEINGISLAETTFTPVSLPGKCERPKHEGRTLRGLRIFVTSRDDLRSYSFGTLLIRRAAELAPEKFEWTGDYYIDRLVGTDEFRKAVDDSQDLTALLLRWNEEAQLFKQKSRRYYLYGD